MQIFKEFSNVRETLSKVSFVSWVRSFQLYIERWNWLSISDTMTWGIPVIKFSCIRGTRIGARGEAEGLHPPVVEPYPLLGEN